MSQRPLSVAVIGAGMAGRSHDLVPTMAGVHPMSGEPRCPSDHCPWR